MTDYSLCLIRLYPDAEWTLTANDYSTLVWLSDSPPPSQDDLDAAWAQVSVDLEWDAVRAERDSLLAGSDWTQVADAPVNKQAWAEYRQQLRDIPQNFDSPDDVVWPAAP